MSRDIKFRVLLIICAVVGILIYSLVFAGQMPRWFPFMEKNALNEWEEKIFKNRVLYSVKTEDIDGYLTAYSDNSASGIFYRLRFDPKERPIVSWKWKVIKFPDKRAGTIAKNGWIEKDDYAARFYVIFPGIIFNLTKTLEYVWDKDLAEGTILTSPYSKNIKIIVAKSGEKNKGNWIYEERNIYEDFKKSFGKKPGRVGAIAIMTDTDNTGSTAEACYDGIKVGYKNDTE